MSKSLFTEFVFYYALVGNHKCKICYNLDIWLLTPLLPLKMSFNYVTVYAVRNLEVFSLSGKSVELQRIRAMGLYEYLWLNLRKLLTDF